MQRFPDVPHVAVFDTAFHQTMPPRAYLYAIPYRFYEGLKVRRYGFHGTSHRFVAGEAAKLLNKPIEELNLVTAHLGNGCSACAIREGHSVDTTMGLTPLEGLVMGTRSGDVDPNLHDYLSRRIDYDLQGITNILNRESGLLGVSGLSNDMRTLVQAVGEGNARADLAVDVFCYRLAKAILGLSAALDRLDAVVFTGGIGENSAPVRTRTLGHLRVLGARVDKQLNEQNGASASGRITAQDSALLALVVATNEELVIARETARFL
jgi:acetate kinase